MAFGVRLAAIALVCMQIVMWTCPAYCASAADPAVVAAAPETATTHEHHHSSTAQSEHSNSVSINPVPAGCCGSFCVEQTPQSLTGKYSASENAPSNATVPLAFSLVTVQRSGGPALAHQPPGTSPPATAVSPLRI